MANHQSKSLIGPKKRKGLFSKYERVTCESPEFSSYAALHKEDFKLLIKYIIELERGFSYLEDEK